jgi:hypothetical protein
MCFKHNGVSALEKVQGDLLLAKRVTAQSGRTVLHARNLCVLHARASELCSLLEAM